MKEVLEVFNKEFMKLSEKDIIKFQEIVNRLININYLTFYKEEDRNIYYFICNNFDCFYNYFYLGGRELTHYQVHKTFVLDSIYTSKLSLNKVTSLILLIIRLLYNQKLPEISLDNQIRINILELQEKYEQLLNSNNERLKINELRDGLKILKRYNLVDFKGDDYQKDDFSIIIYPTIQYAVGINNVNEIISKIESYKGSEENDESKEENEEITEDQIN